MTCFVSDAFKDFKDVLSYKHDIIYLRWIASKLDLNTINVEYLVFQSSENEFYVTHPRSIIWRANKVTWRFSKRLLKMSKFCAHVCNCHFHLLGLFLCFTFSGFRIQGCRFSNKKVDEPIPNKLFDGCYGGNVSPTLASSWCWNFLWEEFHIAKNTLLLWAKVEHFIITHLELQCNTFKYTMKTNISCAMEPPILLNAFNRL